MPMVGDVVYETTRKSESELQREYDIRNSDIMRIINAGITSTLAALLAKALGAATGASLIIGGFAAGAGPEAIQLAIEDQIEDLKESLQEVKDRGAGGIEVTQQFRYTYMSGSGTGWYVSSRPSIVYYYD